MVLMAMASARGRGADCDLDAALRELRAAREAEFRRALEIARAAGGATSGKRERPDDKAMRKAPNEANAEISRAGCFWRVS